HRPGGAALAAQRRLPLRARRLAQRAGHAGAHFPFHGHCRPVDGGPALAARGGCMNDTWWIATRGRQLLWARLREREAGTAEALDHEGNLHAYDSEDTARSMLLDAGYVE